MRKVRQALSRLWQEEDAIGTLEILLIIAVIVIIAVIFRDKVLGWVRSLTSHADQQINDFTSDPASTVSP